MPKSPQRKHTERVPDTNGAEATPPRGAPRVVAPSNRVNVAFPFSQIKLEEPSKELAQLAALVHDLIVAMGEWVPDDQIHELEVRAQAVRDSLR